MKKFYLILLLIFTLCVFNQFETLAQKNLIEASVITNKNDTLNGSIDYREWNLNPISIHFTDKNGKRSLFKPDDIKGFNIPNKDYYISAHVSLDLTSFQTKDLMENLPQYSVKDTALFLLALVKGKASLYYFKDRNNREHYYITKDNSNPEELVIKKSYRSTSEVHTESYGSVVTVEIFKGQLSLLLNDCSDLKKLINGTDYSYNSLRSLVIRYNQCQSPGTEYVKKEEKIKTKFGLLAGPTLTKVTFKNGYDDLTGVKMKDCYSFLAGIEFDLVFPRERAQWSLINELIYKPYSNSGSSTKTASAGWDGMRYDYTFSFKMEYLKLYTLLRYVYPKWKVKPYADFGMSNGYAIKANNSKTIVETFYTIYSKKTTTEPAIDTPRLYEFGYVLGIGVAWWKMSGEFRYEWAQGTSPYIELSGAEKTITFVVSFMF